MRHATFRQLKVFESVARHLSFSRAAEELHLTQPAVSIQVAKLQEHAGLPLFEQMGKRIHLTAAGAEMLRASRNILDQFREVEETLAQFKGVSGGRLNVAVISAGDYFLPRLLVEFAGRHSGVSINFDVCNRRDLLAKLAENQTDLAVMARPPVDADTLNEPFAPHPYVIVAAPAHPLAGKRRIPLARVVREPFVTREKGSDTWTSMQEAFGPRLQELNVAMEIRSTETIKQAVIAGMGLGFLSAHTISRELRAGSIAVLDVQGLPLVGNWYVVHRSGKHLPPVAQAFKSFLLADGERLVTEALEAPPPRRRRSR
ncbi:MULTISPECIES: LysR family transcriptional regulator [Ramlibacter]|uniref:LysR family transcriptional regulator n=1 Tax=Ramlibacter pinisoli TaxID=2682844 RepID=A0A6N8IX62_9BURK|nr:MULTISPECIES: LysR family transcriptional regulator [Ramlibacter]MBA2961483.1 LysR family transcriptional regulator [Ramlibacter sp. CGMCC 1.13660]MVQ31427.1 LysR family transcriptional regulator [Ramlibacter pinisoli]